MPPDEEFEDPFSDTRLIAMQRAFGLLDISKATGDRYINAGELGPILKIGRRSYIRGSDLKLFIDNRPVRKPRAEAAD